LLRRKNPRQKDNPMKPVATRYRPSQKIQPKGLLSFITRRVSPIIKKIDNAAACFSSKCANHVS
jgi:hypothetical protein